MNPFQQPLRAAVFRWGPGALCLLLLTPLPSRGEPPAPSLSEQLARARTDEDQASLVELCRRQLERSPGDTATLQEMFRAQIDLKDYDRAAETLARLGKAAVSPALLAELRGDLAHASDKPLEEVMKAWQEALAAKPADTPALLGKIAGTLDEAGHWMEAADVYHAFLRLKPNHAARTVRLATCLLNAGLPEEADKMALAAGKLDAADDTVKAAAPLFDRLRPQIPVLRKLDERIAVLEAKPGAAAASNAPGPWFERAVIFYRLEAFAAALRDAERAAETGGRRSVAARVLQGQCLWKLGRDKEAVALRVAKIEDKAWFDDQRRCDRLRAPDDLAGTEDDATLVRVYSARALVLLDGKQPVLALEDAEKAAHASEGSARPSADAEVILAAAFLRNDRPADALIAARRAVTYDPRNPDGWAMCGRLEQEAANFPDALENLSRALAIREDAAWLRRRETCLRVLGRNAEADRDAHRATQLPASS